MFKQPVYVPPVGVPVKLAGDTLDRRVLALLFAGSVILTIAAASATITDISEGRTFGPGAVAVLATAVRFGQLLFRGPAPLVLTETGFEKDTWPTEVDWEDVERFASVKVGRKRRVGYFLRPDVRPSWSQAEQSDGYLSRTYGRMKTGELADYLDRWRAKCGQNAAVDKPPVWRYPVGGEVVLPTRLGWLVAVFGLLVVVATASLAAALAGYSPEPVAFGGFIAGIFAPLLGLVLGLGRTRLKLDPAGFENCTLLGGRPNRILWRDVAGFRPWVVNLSNGGASESVVYYLRNRSAPAQRWRRWLRPGGASPNPPDGVVSAQRGGMNVFEFVEYLEAWRKYATGEPE